MRFNEAENFLFKQDAKLAVAIKINGHLEMRAQRGEFESLVRSIIGQQISVKAASNIYERFKGITELKPSEVSSLSDEQIKTIGLSRPKACYLMDLAEHFVKDSAVFNHLGTLNDDDVIAELTRIKGIGVWTAQMFLMFTLRRPDIFAPDDRGLQIAIQNIYKFKQPLKRAELDKLAQKWAPYRSTASLHLWHSLKNEPN